MRESACAGYHGHFGRTTVGGEGLGGLLDAVRSQIEVRVLKRISKSKRSLVMLSSVADANIGRILASTVVTGELGDR